MPLEPLPRELLAPAELCLADGTLNPAARGWSRRPLLRAALHGPFLRQKRWNFVSVSHPELLVAAALSNADYSGLGFVWLYDLRRQRFFDLEQLAPLGIGVKLGDTLTAPAQFLSSALQLRWQPTGGGPAGQAATGLELSITAPRLRQSRQPFSLRLRVGLGPDGGPADESLNLVVPWSERRFNHTAKLAALPASGELVADGQSYRLDGTETLASLDFTRGLWPYRSAWRWASAAGFTAGHRLGLNFGDGWTDGTGMLENALFVDGKVLPLWEPVRFDFDPGHPERPWTVRTTESDRVDLRFTPSYSRAQETNLLVVRMRLQQVLGHFSGTVRLADGTLLDVGKLAGVAENHLARW